MVAASADPADVRARAARRPPSGVTRMAGFVLGIDQGTSGSRALVLDGDGAVRGYGYRPLARLHPAPDRVEQDPLAVAAGVREAIAEALERAGIGAGGPGGVRDRIPARHRLRVGRADRPSAGERDHLAGPADDPRSRRRSATGRSSASAGAASGTGRGRGAAPSTSQWRMQNDPVVREAARAGLAADRAVGVVGPRGARRVARTPGPTSRWPRASTCGTSGSATGGTTGSPTSRSRGPRSRRSRRPWPTSGRSTSTGPACRSGR